MRSSPSTRRPRAASSAGAGTAFTAETPSEASCRSSSSVPSVTRGGRSAPAIRRSALWWRSHCFPDTGASRIRWAQPWSSSAAMRAPATLKATPCTGCPPPAHSRTARTSSAQHRASQASSRQGLCPVPDQSNRTTRQPSAARARAVWSTVRVIVTRSRPGGAATTTVAPRAGAEGSWTSTASQRSPAGIQPWPTPSSGLLARAVAARDDVPIMDRNGRPGPEKLNNELSPERRAALRPVGVHRLSPERCRGRHAVCTVPA